MWKEKGDSNIWLQPEIGPDGLPMEAPVISYTEKIIEEEQLQLRKYIEENYSKIRDVERELANLSMEMKLTAGPKRAALEHLRKKIEMSTERIHVAKLKEEQARKAWEVATKAVKDEEAIKQKLCEDLNKLVQESSNSQLARLEELKRRLGALNPSKDSASSPSEVKSVELEQSRVAIEASSAHSTTKPSGGATESVPDQAKGGSNQVVNAPSQQDNLDGQGKPKKKVQFQDKGRGIGAIPKGRGSAAPGWTGAGFDVDGRS